MAIDPKRIWWKATSFLLLMVYKNLRIDTEERKFIDKFAHELARRQFEAHLLRFCRALFSKNGSQRSAGQTASSRHWARHADLGAYGRLCTSSSNILPISLPCGEVDLEKLGITSKSSRSNREPTWLPALLPTGWIRCQQVVKKRYGPQICNV